MQASRQLVPTARTRPRALRTRPRALPGDALHSRLRRTCRVVLSLPFCLLRLLVAITFAVLVGPLDVSAQTSPTNNNRAQVDFAGLDIQAIAGWDGTVDQTTPIPLSFLISNFSDNVIEGQLILTDPLNGKEVRLGEIFIGPNSVRRFSSIQAMPDWYQCVATFSHEDRILWRRELAITTGKDFSEDVNYLLFVDDGNRMLQWPADETTAEASSSRFVPKPGRGRGVQPLAVRSWQVPQHPGPLTVAQAMVFSETARLETLNDAQWDAIARWICLGGTVFVSEKSTEVIERLKKATPLIVQPAMNIDQLSVHRCGNGSLREYSGPLFSASDTTAPRLIAEAASQLSRYNQMTMIDESSLNWWDSQNADKTRMLVIAVFGIYTLLSGVVTLLLSRLSRRRIAAYTGTVVLAACVAAVVLGGLLRSSDGDLRWVTITQAGPGGVVQLAKIDVQSAGGRNSQVAVRGTKPDLQLVESDTINPRRYYSYVPESNRTGYPPFSSQADLLPDESDACQVNVPITPWGYRQAYATAFDPKVRGLEIKLKWNPPNFPMDTLATMLDQHLILPGQFELNVTNHLPFDLTECRLIISRTVVSQVAGSITHVLDPRTGGLRMQTGASMGKLQHLESMALVENLPISATVTQQAMSMINSSTDDWSFQGRWNDSPVLLPRIAYDGATSAWIVARISRSPILSIDEQRSDFKPLQGLHLFVQEILPEDMPEEWVKIQQPVLERQQKAAAAAKSQ